ncbi:hypothetical protein V6N13_136107 [Hibiscus sabdariffa]
MDCSSSSLSSISLILKPHPALMTIYFSGNSHWSKGKKRGNCLLRVSAISYHDFIDFSLNETKRCTLLLPSPLQEKYSSMIALDGQRQTRLEMLSFETPRIRVLRSMSIEREAMQVLDFAAFPKPEFDLPIFCGNFFTAANTNIVVLDLNPLHNVISRRDYKEKYYDRLMPLGLKYTEAWLELMEQAVEETDPSRIMSNLEAHGELKSTSSWINLHKSLQVVMFIIFWTFWFVGKQDPGHGVLKRLVGEKLAKDLLRNFLFSGIDELGSKTFLDYFPEYWSDDGTISEKRSIIGKGFENRPWDENGDFLVTNFRN